MRSRPSKRGPAPPVRVGGRRSPGAALRLRPLGLGLFPVLAGCRPGLQSALDPASPEAAVIANLTWVMVAVATLILLAVLVLLLVGVLRARNGAARPLDHRHSRNLVLAGGVIGPLIVLFPFIVASAWIDRSVALIPRDAVTIEVIGRQWWWEIHYLDREGRRIAATANEIRVPVGRPVRFELKALDVIHSFWVPNLHGKTDMIPGRVNTAWMQADREGVFRGQCAEFCGLQHARMAFVVVAEAPEVFEAWLAHQAEPAREPVSPEEMRGREVFLAAPCTMCHAIRGTLARGTVAPDLTHLASRRTLAAGTVPNTRGHLAGWILDPQNIKPGSRMPATQLASEELSDLLAYLASLE